MEGHVMYNLFLVKLKRNNQELWLKKEVKCSLGKKEQNDM